MRSLLTTILAMFAALFLAVGGNTLIRGPHIAPRCEAAELQNAPPPRTPEDLTVAGALVRNGSLADHCLDGVYCLPLIDPATADRIETQGTWSPLTRAPGLRLAIVSLDFEQAQQLAGSGHCLGSSAGRERSMLAQAAMAVAHHRRVVGFMFGRSPRTGRRRAADGARERRGDGLDSYAFRRRANGSRRW